jgi:general secretion pathway protein B
MSILLDALKRSESQRELGKVPTLQTSTESSVSALRHAPAWLPFGLVMIAAGLMTWLGLEQFHLEVSPGGSDIGQVQGESPATTDRSSTIRESDEKSSVSGESILPKLAESDTIQPGTELPEQQGAQRREGRQVRDFKAEQTLAGIIQPPKSTEPTRDNAVREAEVANVELSAPSKTGAKSAVPDEYEPEIINYWQVPEKMRDGLPDLRISVLVYAELPENRFVLMNGERLREGEELSNGLLLEEIQRDRAIFNYRNYRFFLKS